MTYRAAGAAPRRCAVRAAAVLVVLVTGACGESTRQLAFVTAPATTAPVPAATTVLPGSTPAGAGATPAPTGVLPSRTDCPASGLAVVVWSRTTAMGLRDVTLRVVNCGTTLQRLNGYPRLQLLDAARRPLAISVTRGSIDGALHDPGAKPFILRVGQVADTVLTWRNVMLQGESLTAAGVRIVPAPGVPAQVLTLTVDTGSTHRVAVTAWRKPQAATAT